MTCPVADPQRGAWMQSRTVHLPWWDHLGCATAHTVNPKHRGQRVWTATVACFRKMRFDNRFEAAPRDQHQRIHPHEKFFLAGLSTFIVELAIGKGELLIHLDDLLGFRKEIISCRRLNQTFLNYFFYSLITNDVVFSMRTIQCIASTRRSRPP